jgi:hypothetical protein
MTPSILRNSKRHIPLSILKANCPSLNLCCKHQCRWNPEFLCKLDAIEVKIIAQSENEAILLAKTKWITRLRSLKYRHEVVKIDGKWFKPKKIDLDIPPNQFLSSNTTEFSSTAEGYFHPADLS